MKRNYENENKNEFIFVICGKDRPLRCIFTQNDSNNKELFIFIILW